LWQSRSQLPAILRDNTLVSAPVGPAAPRGMGNWHQCDITPTLPLGRVGGGKRVHPQPPHGSLLLGTFPLPFCNVLTGALVSSYFGLRVKLALKATGPSRLPHMEPAEEQPQRCHGQDGFVACSGHFPLGIKARLRCRTIHPHFEQAATG